MSGNSRYFQIMSGLRGCYMPDVSFAVRVLTLRELKSHVASEAERQSCDGGFAGLSASQVAWAASHAWTEGAAIMPFGLPRGSRPYAIEVSRISWREYKEAMRHDQNN